MRQFTPQNDPRAAMWERLPRSLQTMLTLITGKAAHCEVERVHLSAGLQLALTLSFFVGGILGAAVLTRLGLLALAITPVPWLLSAGATRAFQTTFLHHGSRPHATLSRNRRLNDLLAEFVSVIAFLPTLQEYSADHHPHHWLLATADDPDLRLILKFGFRPGWKPKQYWKFLRRLLIDPRLYASTMLTRLHSNLIASRGMRRIAAWAFSLAMLGLVVANGWWIEWIVGYWVPVGVLFTAAGLLQVLTEHTWVHLGHGRDPKKLVLSRLTRDRFFGEMPPESGTGVLPWLIWWTRMIFIHLPLRWLVTPLDLVVHAWHHRHPKDFDWTRGSYARRDDLARAEANGIPYLEVWGFGAALALTFDHLTLLPPDADLGEPDSYGWIDPDLLGM